MQKPVEKLNVEGKATAGLWQVIPDFDHLTAYGQYVCTVSGAPNPKGDVVFRPPHPDDVDGYHDVGADAIRQAADYLGWIAPEAYEALKEHAEREHEANIALGAELVEARDALATVTRENVRLQEVIEELNQPFELAFDDLSEEELDEL